MKPLIILLTSLAIAALAYAAFMSWQSSSVDIAIAQAAIESAQAAQEAARAAQITGAGLAMSTILLYAVIGLVVLNLTMVMGFVIYTKTRKAEPVSTPSKWVSGPNARWGRVGEPAKSASLPGGDVSMDDLFKMWMISQMTGRGVDLPQAQPPQRASLPAPAPADDDDDLFSFVR